MRQIRRRFVWAALAGVVALACVKTWSEVNDVPGTVYGSNAPNQIRVTIAGGERFLLAQPQLTADSLIGLSVTGRRAVAVTDLRLVEARRTNAGLSVFVALGVGVASLLAFAAILSTGDWGGSVDTAASCPVVYSWDGAQWRLDAGTFAGAIMPALTRSELAQLHFVVPAGQTIRLRVANDQPETDHIDAVEVITVDHESGTGVAPGVDGRVRGLKAPRPAVRATDTWGRDVTRSVASDDGWPWESRPVVRDTANPRATRDALDLAFLRKEFTGTRGRLVVSGRNSTWADLVIRRLLAAQGSSTDAWFASVAASPEATTQVREAVADLGGLAVSVKENGGWRPQGMLLGVGPEVAKQQVIDIDLARVPGDTVWVRIESSPFFWLIDQVALDQATEPSVSVQSATLTGATLATGEPVLADLLQADARTLRLDRGQRADLTFSVPPRTGRVRSYFLRSTGWYRIQVDTTAPPNSALLAELQQSGGTRGVAAAFLNERLSQLGKVGQR